MTVRTVVGSLAIASGLLLASSASAQTDPGAQYRAMEARESAMQQQRRQAAMAGLAAKRRAADAGDTAAALEAGQLLWQDDGVPPDEFLARRYFEQAAADHPLAAFELGQTWRLGKQPDLVQARRWYAQAAEAGIAAAQVELGRMIARGEGGAADFGQARQWLGRAADAGEPRAQYLLAILDEKGAGQPPDPARAMARYARAFELVDDSPVFDLSRPSAQAYMQKRDRAAYQADLEEMRKALSHVGDLHASQGDVDGALAAYGQALAYDEDDKRSRFMTAMLRMQANRDLGIAQASILRLSLDHYAPALCQLAINSQAGSNGFEKNAEQARAAWGALARVLLSPAELSSCTGDGSCQSRLQARIDAGGCAP